MPIPVGGEDRTTTRHTLDEWHIGHSVRFCKRLRMACIYGKTVSRQQEHGVVRVNEPPLALVADGGERHLAGLG